MAYPSFHVTFSTKLNSVFQWLSILASFMYFTWLVFNFQSGKLPSVVSKDAPASEFSEARAKEKLVEFVGLGPHEFGSDVLEYLAQDVYFALQAIQKDAPDDVTVEVEWSEANSSWINLQSGLFVGKSIVYHNLLNIVARIVPMNDPDAKDNAMLVSTHLDAVKFTEGAGDCMSNVVVMLELVKNLASRAASHRNSLIFLFNTGEEEGLMGSHAFITQHPWATTVRAFVDLEAMGIGGRSSIFQAGHRWLLEQYQKSAPHPSAMIVAQDVFASNFLNSATDYQVYSQVGNLSGLDFAFTERTAVYHTPMDHHYLMEDGSLQHLGENMLPFLVAVASSEELAQHSQEPLPSISPLYFDILGIYMVVIPGKVAQLFYNTFAFQAICLFLPQFTLGGKPALISMALALLSIALSLAGALLFSLTVAILLPLLCYFPVPYVEYPVLALGLFGSPAVAGALVGNFCGRHLLLKYCTALQLAKVQTATKLAGTTTGKGETKGLKSKVISRAPKVNTHSPKVSSTDGMEIPEVASPLVHELAEWDVERWQYKAGIAVWVMLTALGSYFQVGSTYLASAWFLAPAISYALMEAQLSSKQKLRELRLLTVLAGSIPPLFLSAEPMLRLPITLIGTLVRIDRNPGQAPLWLPNALIATLTAVVLCLMLVYLQPYAHRNGGTLWIVSLLLAATVATIGIAAFEVVPAFTFRNPRTVHVTKVFPDLNGLQGQRINWTQFTQDYEKDVTALPPAVIAVGSFTPGSLLRETEFLQKFGLECGKDNLPDLVTFQPRSGCMATVGVQQREDVDISGKDLRKYVTELTLLSDVGEGALGADKWRDGISWWVPGPVVHEEEPEVEAGVDAARVEGQARHEELIREEKAKAEAWKAQAVREREEKKKAAWARRQADRKGEMEHGGNMEAPEGTELSPEENSIAGDFRALSEGGDVSMWGPAEAKRIAQARLVEEEAIAENAKLEQLADSEESAGEVWDSCWTEESGAESESSAGRVSKVGIKVGRSLDYEGKKTLSKVRHVCRRWQVAIDTDRVASFSLQAVAGNESLVSYLVNQTATSTKGWHYLQFRARMQSPRQFILTLFWKPEFVKSPAGKALVKIRSDYQELRETFRDQMVQDVNDALPPYCLRFAKSTLPYNIAYVDQLHL